MAGASCSLAIHLFLSSAWVNITTDANAVDALRIAYGIQGSGPVDCTPGTGDLAAVLQNWATAAGRPQGYYSPRHASVRSGWTTDVPIRVTFTDSADAAKAVTSITRASTTATVTTTAAHGYSTGYWVTMAGAAQADYNGVFQITVIGVDTFTYTVANAPATPATGTITTRRGYVKHYGKVASITPSAGQYRDQKVAIVAYDGVDGLTQKIRSVAMQVNQSEAALMTTVLDAVDAGLQPRARDLDVGVDTLPLAFQDLGAGATALGILHDLAIDTAGFQAMKGDGTWIYRNRQSLATAASAATFNNIMHGFSAPTVRANIVDEARVTIHPPTIDDTASTVVYADQAVRSIAPGETVEFWVTYVDPDTANAQSLIGAIDVVDPLVAATDYAGNSQADGLGTDVTANLTVGLTPFATTAIFSITNAGAVEAFLVNGSGNPFLQIRGKAVRDLGPQTYVSGSGLTVTAIDLRYQDDATFAQSYADYIQARRATAGNLPPEYHEFIANDSAALMTQALAREPGDVIAVTEPVTGVTAYEARIQSVTLEVTPGPWVVCRWGLNISYRLSMWQLGVAGYSELGDTTPLGF